MVDDDDDLSVVKKLINEAITAHTLILNKKTDSEVAEIQKTFDAMFELNVEAFANSDSEVRALLTLFYKRMVMVCKNVRKLS